MKNKPYTLQLLHGNRLFNTREEAFEYINVKFKGEAEWGEPAVFFYGSGNDVKMIMAVGRDENGNICTLDSNDLDVSVNMEDFKSAINAAGLYLDENKITDRVGFKEGFPDPNDNLLRGSQSLAEAIDRISQYAQQIETMSIEDIKIFGNESDTANTSATLVDDSWVINTDVRLSNNNSIIVSEGGLSANVDIDVNEATNTITVTIGNKTKAFSLPGVNVIDNIVYDAQNKVIKIYFNGEPTPITIPIGDIVETWVINNPVTSPIELHKHVTQAEDEVYATIKLRSEDNLIGVDNTNGDMYVSRQSVEEVVNDSMGSYDEALSLINEKVATNTENISQLNDKVAQNTTDISVLRTDTDRNTSDITSLNSDLSNLTTKVNQNEANITVLTQQTDRNTSEISRVETKLDNEITTAREREQILTDSINTTNNAISEEVNRAQGVETQLSARVENAENQLATVDTRIESAVNAERDARTQNDSLLDTKITNLTTTVNEKFTEAKEYAKEYTDSEIHRVELESGIALDNVKSELTILISESTSSSSETAQTYANTAESNAKQYTDEKVATEKERAMTAEQTLSDKINVLNGNDSTVGSVANAIKQSKDYTDEKVTAEKERAQAVENQHSTAITELQTTVNGKVDSVELRQDPNNPLNYSIYVDGSEIGQINIPKDQFLKDATYDVNSKTIELTCITTEGEKLLRINVADLVDEYTAGSGLRLEGNVFSVRINEDTEPYIKLSEEGIKIEGIDAALAGKANTGDSYTKAESDAKYLTDGSIEGFVTENEISDIRDNLNTIIVGLDTIDATLDIITGPEYTEGSIENGVKEAKDYTDTKVAEERERAMTAEESINDKVSIINGNEAVEGSIKNAIKQSKDYTDTKVAEERERAMTAEQALNDKINVLNGNEAVEGSVSNAIKQSKDYTDTKVSDEALTRSNEVSRLETLISGKANSSDVYTKAEIDAKGYLTDANLALYATKSELNNTASAIESVNNAQNTRLDALEASDATQNTKIENIESELVKVNVVDEDTNSIDVNVSKTNSGTKVKADLRLDSTVSNIIRVGGNGVYATIDLTYNSATNTLTLNNGVETKDIQLSEHTLVNSGYYDSENKQIVLVVTANGQTSNIAIPVSDLVNKLVVSNSDNNPVNLHLEPNNQGVDTLSANIDISTLDSNAIVNNNGTLYASKKAEDMTALWEGDSITIQKAIENLKAETDKIGDIETDVNSLTSDVNNIKNQIITINTTIETLQDQVDANTQGVADNAASISELTNNYNNLSERVGAIETNITNIEGEITNINNIIGDYNDTLGTIEQRLTNIEDLLQNGLIDFNDRNADGEKNDDIIVDDQGNIW